MKHWPSVLLMTVVALLIILPLTGCGDSVHQVKKINGHYSVVRVPYEGRAVTCIRGKFGAGRQSWGGISCDWVEFHKGR